MSTPKKRKYVRKPNCKIPQKTIGLSEPWYSSRQIMRLLQISKRCLQYWRDSGAIPFHKTKRTIKYYQSEIETFIKLSRLGAL